MGCGGSKDDSPNKDPKAPASKSSIADDLETEDLDGDEFSKSNNNRGSPQEDPTKLLKSWEAPTNNAAHARIQHLNKDKQPKQRGRPTNNPDSSEGYESGDGADSSDDEVLNDAVAKAPQGQPAVITAPGMADDKPNLLTMFRPRTPNAVMDLD